MRALLINHFIYHGVHWNHLSRHVMHIFLSSNSNLIHELWK